MKSPRGRYRMWQTVPFIIMAIFGLYLLGTDWGNQNIPNWFAVMIKFCGAEAIGLLMLYKGAGIVGATRTHDLATAVQKTERGHAIWVSVSVVTGAALLVSF